MNKKRFPPEIYLTLEQEGTTDEYFQVHVAPETTAAIGNKQQVGRYMLHETLYVETKIIVSPKP